MKNVFRFILVVCLTIVTLLLAACSSDENEAPKEKHSIFEYEELITIYVDSIVPNINELNDVGDSFFGLQNNGKDYVNYYIAASNAISMIIEYREDDNNKAYLEEAISVEKSLMETFKRNGCFPRPEYKDYKDGWVSSMDAPTIMVLTQMIYEITGEEQYQNFKNELKEYVLHDTSRGGVPIPI